MTAQEIQNSGINNNVSRFQVTLKNGESIEFRADFPDHVFFTFHFESNTLWAYQYYNSKGLQNKHIAIKGGDIVNIKIGGSLDELRKSIDKANSNMHIVLVIFLLIGLIIFMNSHCH